MSLIPRWLAVIVVGTAALLLLMLPVAVHPAPTSVNHGVQNDSGIGNMHDLSRLSSIRNNYDVFTLISSAISDRCAAVSSLYVKIYSGFDLVGVINIILFTIITYYCYY